RPAPVREPGAVRPRPAERPPAPRVRLRPPHVSRRAPRPSRGVCQHRTAARPPRRHPDLGIRARATGREALRVRAHLHPEGLAALASGVHAGRRGLNGAPPPGPETGFSYPEIGVIFGVALTGGIDAHAALPET